MDSTALMAKPRGIAREELFTNVRLNTAPIKKRKEESKMHGQHNVTLRLYEMANEQPWLCELVNFPKRNETTCIKICETLEGNHKLHHNDLKGRNLLREGWFVLAKCVIERSKCNAAENNNEEYGWNAFFYCARLGGDTTEQQKDFLFLHLEKQAHRLVRSLGFPRKECFLLCDKV